MERLGVRYFGWDQGTFLPLKRPSRHLGIGHCDDTAVRIRFKKSVHVLGI